MKECEGCNSYRLYEGYEDNVCIESHYRCPFKGCPCQTCLVKMKCYTGCELLRDFFDIHDNLEAKKRDDPSIPRLKLWEKNI